MDVVVDDDKLVDGALSMVLNNQRHTVWSLWDHSPLRAWFPLQLTHIQKPFLIGWVRAPCPHQQVANPQSLVHSSLWLSWYICVILKPQNVCVWRKVLHDRGPVPGQQKGLLTLWAGIRLNNQKMLDKLFWVSHPSLQNDSFHCHKWSHLVQ